MKEMFQIKSLCWILAGNTIYALAVVLFILPNHLITGGTTGLALLFYHQYGVPVSAFVSVSNVVMFLLGAVVLGKKFAVTTLVSTFYYPLALEVLQGIPQLRNGMTDNAMLAVVFAGLMIGLAIGMVISAGASTGGLDIPPLVLNKKFGFSVSVVMYAIDFLILLGQMLFSSREQVLYGILLVLIYTVVLDRVLLTGKSQMQVKIISTEYEEINQKISEQLDRGATLFHSETGHLRNGCLVVLTVISSRELPKLNKLVLSIDPKAFMIINQVNEVKGRGFSMSKQYR